MNQNRSDLLRLARCNIAVAYQILYSVSNADAEAGIHVLRAWFAIAALSREATPPVSEFSFEFLGDFDRTKIPFTLSLGEEEWEKELKDLVNSSQSTEGTCRLDTLRLLEHCDLLKQTLVRLDGGRKRFSLKLWKVKLPKAFPLQYWFAGFGVVLAIAALVAIRPMLIEGSGKPWRAEYYAGVALTGVPAIVRPEEQVDFDWTHSHPRDFVRKGYYSVRFDTCLKLSAATQVNFELGSDDGARMFVDGRKVIDGWKTRAFTTEQASAQLARGVHHLRVEYFEKGGSAIIRMRAKLDNRGFRNLSDRDIFYPGDEIDPRNPCKNVS